MQQGALAATAIFGAAAAMLAYVSLRRGKSAFHWKLLCLLLGILIWTSGSLLRHAAADAESLRVALEIGFAGILLVIPCWLLLALHHADPRWLPVRRAHAFTWFVPSILFYFALLTNPLHRLFLRELGFESLAAGPARFAGPLFWVCAAWTLASVSGALLLHLSSAARLAAGDARRRSLLLALACAVPLGLGALYLLPPVRPAFDATPLVLGASLALIAVSVFRYELLDDLPLARRDVVERLADGVIMASGGGLVLDLNPAAARIVGRPAEAPRGGSLAELMAELADARDGPPLLALLERVMRGAPGESLEICTPDQRRVEVFPSAVRYGRAAAVGVFVILRDRTDERRYERIVRQTQRLETVGALAAGIAHEVNGPLAFVRANLAQIERMGDLIEEAEADSDAALAAELADLRPIARETLDGVERIARIAGDLRRLAAGSEEAKAPLDLAGVVRDALRLVQLGPDSSPRVALRLPESRAWVEGSGERLMQVVLNLLVNAQHALLGRPEGEIRVAVRSDAGSVELVVEDDGPGIPEAAQDRIFDPFFTTKGPDEGMGLGLSVAFDIARDHGGVLEERSLPGRGARFVLRLPALAEYA